MSTQTDSASVSMLTRLERLEFAMDENTRITKEVLHCLNGNGSLGLKTRMVLLEQNSKRLYWVCGLVLTSLLPVFGLLLWKGAAVQLATDMPKTEVKHYVAQPVDQDKK